MNSVRSQCFRTYNTLKHNSLEHKAIFRMDHAWVFEGNIEVVLSLVWGSEIPSRKEPPALRKRKLGGGQKRTFQIEDTVKIEA